jgi:hypothetical protein
MGVAAAILERQRMVLEMTGRSLCRSQPARKWMPHVFEPYVLIVCALGIETFQLLPSEPKVIAAVFVGNRFEIIGAKSEGGPPAEPVKIVSSAARCSWLARLST